MSVTYNIISSSSKGNAILVNNYMLIDCGVSFKKIKPYLNGIKVICLTHL